MSVVPAEVTAENDKEMGGATDEAGVKEKYLLLPSVSEPIFAMGVNPKGLAPATIVLVTKVEPTVKVGVAPIVTEPTVVAVLLEAMDIDLV